MLLVSLAALAAPQLPCDEVKLLAADGAAQDRYGYGIELDGSRLLVPAKHDAFPLPDQGSAHVYELIGGAWRSVAHFGASDAQDGDLFGWESELQGDRAVFGAPFHDGPVVDSGSAYVFDQAAGVWSETVRLDADDAGTGDSFGRDVVLDGDRIVVGAPFDDDNGQDSGSVYVFELVGGAWTQTQKLTASDGAAEDRFGWNCALQGETIVVGSHGNDEVGPSVGAAYVFELVGGVAAYSMCPQGPCGNDDPFAGCANSTGQGAYLTACGSTSVGADDLVLTASGLPASQFGIYFMGAAPDAALLGDGIRSVGPGSTGLFRFPPRGATPAGVLTEGPGIATLSYDSFPPAGRIVAGSTSYFTAWYRDVCGTLRQPQQPDQRDPGHLQALTGPGAFRGSPAPPASRSGLASPRGEPGALTDRRRPGTLKKSPPELCRTRP